MATLLNKWKTQLIDTWRPSDLSSDERYSNFKICKFSCCFIFRVRQTSNLLCDIYTSSAQNPYETALQLCEQMPDYHIQVKVPKSTKSNFLSIIAHGYTSDTMFAHIKYICW
jgi:hypothetical protein